MKLKRGNKWIASRHGKYWYSSVAGVQKDPNRANLFSKCKRGDKLSLQREPRNPVDPNAVAVYVPSKGKVGYLPRELAEKLASSLDRNVPYRAEVIDTRSRKPCIRLRKHQLKDLSEDHPWYDKVHEDFELEGRRHQAQLELPYGPSDKFT